MRRTVFVFWVLVLATLSASWILFKATDQPFQNQLSVLSSKVEPAKISSAPPYFKDLNFEKISLSESVYAIKNGGIYKDGEKISVETLTDESSEVLRLALFYEWFNEDPLLVDSNFDLENFGKSLTLLKATQASFLKTYGFKDDFYPDEFLADFLAANEAYAKLRKDVSDINAGDLAQKLEKAVSSYKSEAEKLKNTISGLGGQILAGRIYASLGGETYITADIILGDLERIISNANALNKELDERKKCLFGSPEFCQRPLLALASLPRFGSLPNTAVASAKFLSKEELGFKSGVDYRGPYIVNSKCWQKKNKQFLYNSDLCFAGAGYCMQNGVLATNAYFTKLADFFALDKFFKAKGLEVIPQSATTQYDCNDLSYQPALGTLDYFFRKYKNDRIFSTLQKFQKFNSEDKKLASELEELSSAGKRAEENFFDATYPSEDALVNLSEFYGYAYGFLAKNNLDFNSIKSEFLGRHLIIKNKLADINLPMNRAAFHQKNLEEMFKPLEPKPSPNYIYTIRSAYSLLFFNFSPAIWRNETKPDYLTQAIEDGSQAYTDFMMDYQTAILHYGKDKLDEWRKIYSEIDRETFYQKQLLR